MNECVYSFQISHTVLSPFHAEYILNEEAGFLLRTKLAHADETGVAAGFGSVDSPFLVPVAKALEDALYGAEEGEGQGKRVKEN